MCTRLRLCACALGLGIVLALAVLFVIPASAEPDGTYRYVAATGSDASNNCTNPASPCATIQHAIDVASSGEIVLVDTGTYYEHITMKDGVSVHGEGWDYTIIDGNHTGANPTVFISSVSASTVLSGVQVTGGGTGVYTTSVQDGGGIAIWYASPTIINTFVNHNTGRNGGGVFARNSSPSFNNVPAWFNEVSQRGGGFYLDGDGTVSLVDASLFSGANGTIWLNTAAWDGGGICIYGVTATVGGLRIWWNSAGGNGGGVDIENNPNQALFLLNMINANNASNGGGINAYNAAKLSLGLNTFDGNEAKYSGGGGQFSISAGLVQSNWVRTNKSHSSGGGLAVVSGSPNLTLRGNWIEDNQSGYGGGNYFGVTASPLFDGNVIVSNKSNTAAGIGTLQAGAVKITNNIIVSNEATTTAHMGGGFLVDSTPAQIINNTIANNNGDGIVFQQSEGIKIFNNIISENNGHGIEHYYYSIPTLDYTVDYNDVWNNAIGGYENVSTHPHDLAFNPGFVGSGDARAYYHILPTSPISTTGSTTWAPPFDIDGDTRVLDGSVAMGADDIAVPEFPLFLPLVRR